MGLRAGLDWCGKSRPTGIRSPDRPARRQSLYRLRYPAHYLILYLYPSKTVCGRNIIHNYLLDMIPYCYSNYFVSIGDPTVRLTTLLIESVLFECLKMTQ